MFHGLASREKLLLQDPVRAGEDDVKQLPNTSTVSLFAKELPNTKLDIRLLKYIYIYFKHGELREPVPRYIIYPMLIKNFSL